MRSFSRFTIPQALIISVAVCAHGAPLPDRILAAGNADSDEARLEILKGVRTDPELSPGIEHDLDSLITFIRKWVHHPRIDFFGSQVLKTEDYDFGVAEDSPLHPLTHLYRGRMRVWVILEYGGINKEREVRRRRFDQARRDFEEYRKHFPENRIAAMYLGEVLPNERSLSSPDNAPAWAVAQRTSIERLADIIHWWIDHRLQENGEYGGGWGDDCEMWRWWVPILIGFEDPKIIEAQRFFSRALMAQDHMKRGYTDHLFDVEHTAEDSADVITPMMHLEPDNPEWSGKALRLADLFENLWTGTNDRGFLQFKSTYFNVDTVSDESRKACDTVYHPRAVQPALLYWQRTGDPRLGSLFTRWMETWVDAAAREENGKPAGIVPSAIHWPGGRIGGLTGPWWDPGNHTDDPLYVWPSSMSMMLQTLLLTHHMTGDDKFLEPLRSMAAIRLNHLKAGIPPDPEPGSEAWCASKLSLLSPTAAKYRFLTGKPDFNDLLGEDSPPYVRFRMTGETEDLVQALEESARALDVNLPGYTSEVRYTDRVLRYPSVFGPNSLFEEAVEEIDTPDPALIYSTLTGDPGDLGYFPMNAVRWRTPPRDFAALVTESSDRTLTAEVYHFGDAPRELTAEFFLLREGDYRWSMDFSDLAAEGTITLGRDARRLPLVVPPRVVCRLKIERAN